MSASLIHIVRLGETLSSIARRYQTSIRAIARYNGLKNVNLINVGQRLIIPRVSTSHSRGLMNTRQRTQPNRPEAIKTHNAAGILALSPIDVIDIKKTLQTEWVQSAGIEQAHGIIDTILNRTASRHWGLTVADVVNSRNQFSDINGPISRRSGRNAVSQLPSSIISRRVHQVVDDYLVARATGRGSIVGSHLNYANPHYSDAKNLEWINALDGPRLGKGQAIHYHGTTPSLQRYRPGRFTLVLPSFDTIRQPSTQGRRIDGAAIAAAHGVAVKSANVRLGQLDPAMASVIRTVAEVARELKLPTPVITSGNDSRHRAGSMHYANRALDFRGNNISISQGQALRQGVTNRLGENYDVVFETFSNATNNHLHIEYDPD